ncbi:MAG TPA: DUF1844 domain-containing protein [Phycisphaerae bacterium]|nr:DUF1844 domain-containing protein [Phycisphaerae bacterium]
MTEEKAKPEQVPEANKSRERQSKIHVDADWKRQAQEEKERLVREVEGKASGAEAAASTRRAHRIPPADFSTLVQTLATQAALFLGDHRDPKTGKSLRNLDLAKHHIDLLGVLEEKTKGKLTDEEKRLLDTLLYELRLAYASAAS